MARLVQTTEAMPRVVLLVLAAALACDAPEPAAALPPDPVPAGGKADGAADEREGMPWDEIAARCAPPAADEPVVYLDDFRWDYSLEDMEARFWEIYESGKRLAGRAYYDPERDVFVMPHVPAWGGEVMLSRRLVENVRRHIERSLARNYADFVFFPDMGHAHLFIPEDRWDQVYAGAPVSELSARYAEMFDDPSLRVLYHTAEQLAHTVDGELVADRYLQWRHFTRNVVGDNRGLGQIDLIRDLSSSANTAHHLEGHRYHGAGFELSASAEGCFPFVKDGEILYFDLSLTPLASSNPGGF
jgi:hypothetical protein